MNVIRLLLFMLSTNIQIRGKEIKKHVEIYKNLL